MTNCNETLNESLMRDLANVGRKKECCSITKFIEDDLLLQILERI